MERYGWDYQTALWFPLPAGLALTAAIRERDGVDDGNTFADRERHKAMDTMKQFLKDHYELV
jgi:hypothetical protein